MNGRRVTSVDVARLAGVSQSAVSRAFRPGASVSNAMAERVRQAAEQLGYRPNILARSLNTGRTKIIGVAISYLESPFYSLLIEKLSRRLQQYGFHVLIFLANEAQSDVNAAVDEFLDYQVDAIVTASVALNDKITQRCEAAGIPIVMLNRGQQNEQTSEVTSDNFDGGYKVASHLASLGCHRIAHISGWQGASTGVERTAGFLAGLNALGMKPSAVLDGGYSQEKAAGATRRLFANGSAPDAIFVGSDYMAFSVMDVIRYELGRRIPQDVMVAGYDDVPIAAWKSYQLTTVRQPLDVMVGETVEILLSNILGGIRSIKTKIANDLIIRQSTGMVSTFGFDEEKEESML